MVYSTLHIVLHNFFFSFFKNMFGRVECQVCDSCSVAK